MDPDSPRFLIVNNCAVRAASVHVWQTKGSQSICRVAPCKKIPFSWDDPDNSKLISFRACMAGKEQDEHEVRTINFKIAGQEGTLCGGRIIWSTSVVMSHTRVLEFNDAEDIPGVSSPTDNNDSDKRAASDQVTLSFKVNGIAMSLVDHQRQEVLYATLLGIDAVIRADANSNSLDLSIGKLQVDNQTRLGPPVALVCPYACENLVGSNCFLKARVERNVSVTSMKYWNLVRVEVGRLCIDVYEAWLHVLLSFESMAQPSESVEDDDLIDHGAFHGCCTPQSQAFAI